MVTFRLVTVYSLQSTRVHSLQSTVYGLFVYSVYNENSRLMKQRLHNTCTKLHQNPLRTEMSSFLTRSLQQQYCRRLPQPVCSLFEVPRRNYFIVYNPNDKPPEFITRSRVTRFEFQKRQMKEDMDNEAHEFGSDPYPFYRKVTAVSAIMMSRHVVATSCSLLMRADCKHRPGLLITDNFLYSFSNQLNHT